MIVFKKGQFKTDAVKGVKIFRGKFYLRVKNIIEIFPKLGDLRNF